MGLSAHRGLVWFTARPLPARRIPRTIPATTNSAVLTGKTRRLYEIAGNRLQPLKRIKLALTRQPVAGTAHSHRLTLGEKTSGAEREADALKNTNSFPGYPITPDKQTVEPELAALEQNSPAPMLRPSHSLSP